MVQSPTTMQAVRLFPVDSYPAVQLS